MRTPAAFGADRLLRHQAMAERVGHRHGAGEAIIGERPRHRQRENVELARIRHVAEVRRRRAEILAEHVRRHVLEPVAEQEGVVLGEAAIVEHQQELAAVGAEPLDRVRDAFGEVPEVADADVVDELAALLVDRGDAGAAVEHVGPLGGLVPMQLAHAAGV